MLAFRNEFDYRKSDLQILNGNFDKDRSSNPGNYDGRMCNFWDDTAKSAYLRLPNIPSNAELIFTKFSAFVEICIKIITLT